MFKVGGKMFCVACTEVAPNVTSFKCDDETFAELCERDGIIPAPYMARAKWVALERWDAFEDRELKPLLERAYALVKESCRRSAGGAGRRPPPRSAREGCSESQKGASDEEIERGNMRTSIIAAARLLPCHCGAARWRTGAADRRRPPTGGR